MVACEKASGLTIKREDAPRRAGDPAVVSSLAQSPPLLVHSGVMLSRWLVVAVNLRPEPCEHALKLDATGASPSSISVAAAPLLLAPCCGCIAHVYLTCHSLTWSRWHGLHGPGTRRTRTALRLWLHHSARRKCCVFSSRVGVIYVCDDSFTSRATCRSLHPSFFMIKPRRAASHPSLHIGRWHLALDTRRAALSKRRNLTHRRHGSVTLLSAPATCQKKAQESQATADCLWTQGQLGGN